MIRTQSFAFTSAWAHNCERSNAVSIICAAAEAAPQAVVVAPAVQMDAVFAAVVAPLAGAACRLGCRHTQWLGFRLVAAGAAPARQHCRGYGRRPPAWSADGHGCCH